MFKIRNSCFETNSSSSHAMIMMKEDQPLPQMFEPIRYMGDSGMLLIWRDDLEFERSPFSVLTDWYHRMCYAIASYGKDMLHAGLINEPEIEVIKGVCDDEYKDPQLCI